MMLIFHSTKYPKKFIYFKEYISKISGKSNSLVLKLSDCQSLLNRIKQLFFITNKEEQLRLLTIAPLIGIEKNRKLLWMY